tara:strand:+ start:265 stop:546 length:282 start_codon:yes stop_codon:yes gene_type:complete
MGKMKEKFLEDQEKAIQDAIDAFMDDDYQLEEYYTSMKPEDCSGNCEECECDSEPVTQEESQANHDAWWNSLTEEQKQQLYTDQEEAFKQDKS